MKNLLLVVLIVFAGYAGFTQYSGSSSTFTTTEPARSGDEIFAQAFASRARNVQVQGEGIVSRILADDNDGSKHQRFLVRLKSGQMLLIAHNIDLAARVRSLREGDTVVFSGEYEWNAKGGVVHWTHHDPTGRHPGGWIKHAGQRYE